MNKYQPLSEYLTNLADEAISLTFREIEQILDFPLPQSAAHHRQWWENSQTHVQAVGGWLSCGWYVTSVNLPEKTVTFQKQQSVTPISHNQSESSSSSKGAKKFEEHAQEKMSAFFGKPLRQRRKDSWAKLFELVSDDFQVVGDIKCLTMGRAVKIPPAKASIISELVWMLERTKATKTFIVFGKDKRVPQEWLRRYGNLVDAVEFYFLEENGSIERLK
jgi:hypothetical protein